MLKERFGWWSDALSNDGPVSQEMFGNRIRWVKRWVERWVKSWVERGIERWERDVEIGWITPRRLFLGCYVSGVFLEVER